MQKETGGMQEIMLKVWKIINYKKPEDFFVLATGKVFQCEIFVS